ncbi:MAG: hypothetical protein KAU28_09110, partial [Phycisphaerae bacterium]|nr:hypothetical protein [Phycisphaerae bacterium]
MAKKKNSVALFEVISKARERHSQDGMAVPNWMGKGDQQEQEEVPAVAEKTLPPKSSFISSTYVEPMVSITGGRLRLTLNQTSCIVIAAGLIVLLASAFFLGRLSAGSGQEPHSPGSEAGIVNGGGQGAS